MGIFTSRVEKCDRCGSMAVFDGGFSDCGCYYPRSDVHDHAPKGSINNQEQYRLDCEALAGTGHEAWEVWQFDENHNFPLEKELWSPMKGLLKLGLIKEEDCFDNPAVNLRRIPEADRLIAKWRDEWAREQELLNMLDSTEGELPGDTVIGIEPQPDPCDTCREAMDLLDNMLGQAMVQDGFDDQDGIDLARKVEDFLVKHGIAERFFFHNSLPAPPEGG